MPNPIVGFVVAIFMATNAFALGGEGVCRGGFMIFDYILNNPGVIDCENLDGNHWWCMQIAAEYFGDDGDQESLYNDCYNFIYETSSNLNDMCIDVESGNTSWMDWVDGCDYEYQKPYHIRFELDDDGLYTTSAFEELASADNVGVRCYNDESDDYLLTVCDCAGQGEDLHSWYEPCPADIYEDGGSVGGTCIAGDDGDVVLLCVSYDELINNDGCDVCMCGYVGGEVLATDWERDYRTPGKLVSFEYFVSDLKGADADISNWPDAVAGCSFKLTGVQSACESGYYKISTSCGTCPTHESGLQTSEYANTSGLSACYVPAGSYSDKTGSYTYTQNCSVSN